MKTTLVALLLALLHGASLAEITGPNCTGVIHGTAIAEGGSTVPALRLVLMPLGIDLAYVLPTTITNNLGEYQFDHVCAGRFTVLVDDERAGYPPSYFLEVMSTFHEVTLTPEVPSAELAVRVPPKAGLLEIVVRNSRTHDLVSNFNVFLRTTSFKMYDWLEVVHHSGEPLSLPANTELMCRVRAKGFREWEPGKKKRVLVRLEPERKTVLEVFLEPQS